MTAPFVEQRSQPVSPPGHEPEVTLSSGMLVAICAGLVLLCGLCFGLGYSVGHHRSAQDPVAAAQPVDSVQLAQEVSASAPKPSANKQSAASGAASTTPDAGGQASDPAATAASDTQAGASSRGSQPDAAGASPGTPETTSTQAQPVQTRPVAPAMSANSPSVQPATGFASGVRVQPAMPSQAAFLVQIASVSRPEDASVLVNALRQRGYTVTAQRKPEDGLIHVWIGPFNTRDEANRWKLKLLDDGYNAIVQP
jgi:DedD protein